MSFRRTLGVHCGDSLSHGAAHPLHPLTWCSSKQCWQLAQIKARWVRGETFPLSVNEDSILANETRVFFWQLLRKFFPTFESARISFSLWRWTKNAPNATVSYPRTPGGWSWWWRWETLDLGDTVGCPVNTAWHPTYLEFGVLWACDFQFVQGFCFLQPKASERMPRPTFFPLFNLSRCSPASHEFLHHPFCILWGLVCVLRTVRENWWMNCPFFLCLPISSFPLFRWSELHTLQDPVQMSSSWLPGRCLHCALINGGTSQADSKGWALLGMVSVCEKDLTPVA